MVAFVQFIVFMRLSKKMRAQGTTKDGNSVDKKKMQR
jgi:hypothetical protein